MNLDTSSWARTSLLLLTLLCFAPGASAQDQGAMFYSGEFNNFGADAMTYIGAGPDNWVVTLTAPVTDTESNFLFRDSSTDFDNKWSRGDVVSFDALTTWFWQGGDSRINATAGNSYTFIVQDVLEMDNSSGIVIETSGPLALITSASATPITPQGSQQPTITAALSAPVPTGQGVYARSTTDAFATSTVTELTCAAVSCSGQIPAAPTGTTVTYYVFSSADGLTISGAQADRFTANLNNNGGSNFTYTVSATEATVTGADGYRMLAAPEAGFTVGDLQAFSLVQGVAESDPAEGDNVYTYDNTGTYVGAASTSDPLASGRGFFWFLRDTDAGGSSEFPVTLTSSGAAPTSDVNVAFSTLDFLAGNPFQGSLNVGSLTLGGGDLQNDVSIWDPNGAGMSNGNSGTYVTRSRAANETVAGWQGFWVEVNDVPPPATKQGGYTITYPISGVTSGAEFVGGGIALTKTGSASPLARLRFRLEGDGVVDAATSLVIAPEATVGYDVYDLGKLTPLAQRYVTLAFEDGDQHYATGSVPSGANEAIRMPLAINAVGYTGDVTLTWAPAEAGLPEGWAYLLEDLVTGETVDLLTADRHTFSVTEMQTARSAQDIAAQANKQSEGETRFILHVGPTNVVSTQAPLAPEADALTAMYPNPTTGAARVAMNLASGGDATLVIFDMLGREVARKDLGARTAGSQNVTLETTTWAPGTYLVRLDVDGTPRATRSLVRVR